MPKQNLHLLVGKATLSNLARLEGDLSKLKDLQIGPSPCFALENIAYLFGIYMATKRGGVIIWT
jgi:hypothetical protein